MKGVTYTQVAQYCVLIVAYTIPAVFISLQLTGNPIPAPRPLSRRMSNAAVRHAALADA
jgi:Na+(H+)/acetate symporter ActP